MNAYSLTIHEDRRREEYDWLVTLLTLQGIANRRRPTIYFDARDLTDWIMADRRRRKINETEYGIRCRLLRSRLSLLENSRHAVRGAVVYDPKLDAGRWVAVTLAALEDLLPMTPAQLKEIPWPIEVRHDLRGRWDKPPSAYNWAIRELLPRCAQSICYNAGYSHDEVDMGYDGGVIMALDYVVARRGFVFNLAPCDKPARYFRRRITGYPEDVRLMRRILRQLEVPAAVYGWAEPEWTFTTLLNRHGHYLMCGRAANLSFHAAIKVPGKPRRFRQTKPAEMPRLEKKCYIAFMTSEGDTPRVSSSFFMGGWFDKARGKVPVNWGMNPTEATTMPAHVKYFYDTATPQDYFYSGVGGAGYVFLNRLTGPERYIRHAGPHFRRAGMDIVELWHNGEIRRQRYVDYVTEAKLRGIVHLPSGDCHVEYLPGGKPVVFMDKKLVHYGGSPRQVAGRIRAIARRGPLPAFVPVYNSPRPDAVTRFRAVAELLDPDQFVPVRLDVMTRLTRQARTS